MTIQLKTLSNAVLTSCREEKEEIKRTNYEREK
jgi:hypothetical protein